MRLSRPAVVVFTTGCVLTGAVVLGAGMASAECAIDDIECQVFGEQTAAPTGSATASATPSATASATPTATASATASATPSATSSGAPAEVCDIPNDPTGLTCAPATDPSATPTGSASATPTATASATPTATASATPSATPTATASASPSGSASATPTASPAPTVGADGTYASPRTGCAEFSDPSGDGLEDEVDITQVNLKSPADSLQVFVKVVDLSAAPFAPTSTPVYSVELTVAGKKIGATADADGAADGTVNGAASTRVGATAKLDTATSTVVFTFPKKNLEGLIEKPLATGTPITGTKAVTIVDDPLFGGDGDTATGTTDAEKTYSYGDNGCFVPAAAVLTLAGATAGTYSDPASLTVTAKDAAGTLLRSVKIGVGLGGGSKTFFARTNANGVATFAMPVLADAGRRVLTAYSEKVATAGAGRTTKAFTVRGERSVMTVTTARGSVTAKLLDDDKHVIPGAPVVFTYGTKTVVLKSNASGVAILTGQPRGRVVRVAFSGVKGKYTQAHTSEVRVP